MELRLYDTLTKEKRVFTPLDPGNVRMYVCGPTVYDFAHIGNARPVIVFDVLFRLLRHLYGENHVTYVRNITDVDDKINDRAARDFPGLPLNEAIRKVTEQTERQFHEDVDALGCLRPTVEPRATEHIAEMRAIIERLVQGGFAYVAEDHVLFSPQAMNAANSVLPRYGALANRSLDEMIAGARVDVAPYKRDATDFVLWKPSKPGEPSWPSPAGIKPEGRPGWHIECSAMADKLLWEDMKKKLSSEGLKSPHQFDIHGGGIDLVFPHHENELAQSCCAFHENRMANFWMHNGFLQVEGEKMSKSLGNFVTIRDLLGKWPGDVLRLQMLMAHYRSPIDWTEERALQANTELEDWSHVLQSYYSWPDSVFPQPKSLAKVLADDLDTPNALTMLREQYARAKKGTQADVLEFAASCRLMGFRNLDKPGLFEHGTSGIGEGSGPLLFQNAERVQALRAAYANTATPEVLSSIKSEIEQTGVKVEVNSKYKIELVVGDRGGIEAKVDDLIKLRTAARARKDFKESDRIRDQLAAMGIVLKDGKDADGKPTTVWEIAR
jgi:cysteinyl-tRNA synthetase